MNEDLFDALTEILWPAHCLAMRLLQEPKMSPKKMDLVIRETAEPVVYDEDYRDAAVLLAGALVAFTKDHVRSCNGDRA